MTHKAKKTPESAPDSTTVDITEIDTISTGSLIEQDSLSEVSEISHKEPSQEVDPTETTEEDLSAITYLYHFFVVEYFLTFFSVLIVLIVILQRLFRRQWINSKENYLLVVGCVFFSGIGVLHYEDLLWGYWVMLIVYITVAMESWISKRTVVKCIKSDT